MVNFPIFDIDGNMVGTTAIRGTVLQIEAAIPALLGAISKAAGRYGIRATLGGEGLYVSLTHLDLDAQGYELKAFVQTVDLEDGDLPSPYVFSLLERWESVPITAMPIGESHHISKPDDAAMEAVTRVVQQLIARDMA